MSNQRYSSPHSLLFEVDFLTFHPVSLIDFTFLCFEFFFTIGVLEYLICKEVSRLNSNYTHCICFEVNIIEF